MTNPIATRPDGTTIFQQAELELAALRAQLDALAATQTQILAALTHQTDINRQLMDRLAALEATPEPEPEPSPTSDIPAPPLFPATPQTVVHWDWDTATIYSHLNKAPASDPTAPVSANDTTQAFDMNGPGAASIPANSDDVHTWIIPTQGKRVVEMQTHHNAVRRPQGTAARLFVSKWGFFNQYIGQVVVMDTAIYFPHDFTMTPGPGKGLGAGVQVKSPNVLYIMQVGQLPEGHTPWLWEGVDGTLGVTGPLEPYVYPKRTWVTVRIESLLAETDGWMRLYIGGKLLFHLRGRTVIGSIGHEIYDVNSVGTPVRMLVADMRIDIVKP